MTAAMESPWDARCEPPAQADSDPAASKTQNMPSACLQCWNSLGWEVAPRAWVRPAAEGLSSPSLQTCCPAKTVFCSSLSQSVHAPHNALAHGSAHVGFHAIQDFPPSWPPFHRTAECSMLVLLPLTECYICCPPGPEPSRGALQQRLALAHTDHSQHVALGMLQCDCWANPMGSTRHCPSVHLLHLLHLVHLVRWCSERCRPWFL
mmetsp:Transcript_16507/g.27956  ORF Transcript_16507/g.27956 Transcript_16507/m.27956 type:complete len:206 (-) Transcript_16507:368-985(-)